MKWWARIVGTIFLGLVMAGCSRPRVMEIDGFAEGTTYHIKYWSPQAVSEETLRSAFNDAMADVDTQISTYRKDSIVENFNHNPSTDWQPLPAQVMDLLAIAQHVYRESHGCYDPTVKPLFDLWGFHADVFHAPTPGQIVATKKEVGFDNIVLDVAHHRVRKAIPSISVDLSSMGEGYTAWRLSKVLEQHGIKNYLVEFGGDMWVKGHKPGGRKWRIGIERPVPNTLSVQKGVRVNDNNGVSINTSGTYRHFFAEHGKTYSHILDPRTGAPVTHDLVSATVFGNDPRVSDAWATAMLCLGQKQGMEVARKEHLKVFFIQQENGRLVESRSPALIQSHAVSMQ